PGERCHVLHRPVGQGHGLRGRVHQDRHVPQALRGGGLGRGLHEAVHPMSDSYGRASYDFANAVAVVTGGASGIGAEVVVHLRRCGARVAVWDMAELADDDAWQVDVTDLDSVERAAQEVVKRFGRIDFVVNSAGFAGPTMSLDAYD